MARTNRNAKGGEPTNGSPTFTLSQLADALQLIIAQQAEAQTQTQAESQDDSGSTGTSDATSDTSDTSDISSPPRRPLHLLDRPMILHPNFTPTLPTGSQGLISGPSTPSTAERWYAVIRGRAVGVFEGWHNVSPLVTGVSYAIYQRYSSRSAAQAAFDAAEAAGTVAVLP
ncbi:hypothetical protein A0H81_10929 [Grifola frondosa]|uniref:Ribonuclease H1 N-terminal domain-containing protein n=1 Tax=Grifola frondosa TaxID=5627 RepID=A0A1C7LXB4_GRIFR|nr:hypothetical protein A0H81_10929 [Grifola frondosa]